jgi:AcrR family transcriptional regulator
MTGRRSAVEALHTRDAILRRAADIGSVDGLEGLTIGRLAGELEMSKSGVLGHFGSKEALQIATLELAADIFRVQVWEPARHLRPGLERLLGICEHWTRYAAAPSFPGGCFMAAASFEWDGRDGPVHDALAKLMRRWRRTLAGEVVAAVEAGELPPDTDPDEVAFGLEALASGVNPARQLQGDADAAAWCLRAMHAIIGVRPALVAAPSA